MYFMLMFVFFNNTGQRSESVHVCGLSFEEKKTTANKGDSQTKAKMAMHQWLHIRVSGYFVKTQKEKKRPLPPCFPISSMFNPTPFNLDHVHLGIFARNVQV